MGMLKKILLGIVVIVIGVGAFLYFGTISDGVRSGIIMKISKRGVIFKTYEGQMNLETFGAVKSKNIVSETFEFSVDKNDKDLIKTLEEASLSGKRINVRYKQRYMTFPWRGETKYFVYEVDGLEKKDNQNSEKRKTPFEH